MNTQIIKYQDNIYAIEQGIARAFLILGNQKALLFDTGVLPANLSSLIKSITTLPVQLVLSHADPDHIANAYQFDTIYAHPLEALRCKENDELKDKRYICFDHTEYDLGSLHILSSIDLGGTVLKVVLLPGHSKGHIGLLDEKRKFLFSGDVLSYGPIYMFVPNADFTEFKKTLTGLQSIIKKGIVETIFPCHNTCPISSNTIYDLVDCCNGIENHLIESHDIPDSMPFSKHVKQYSFGKCSIYY